MAQRQGQVNENTGRVESKKVAKAKRGDFDITIIDTKAKRIARNLWG
jgi:hypothetical protein